MVSSIEHCYIAMSFNSACAVAVVYSKVARVREKNFVEDTTVYQMATDFQEASLRPDVSITCARHVIHPLPVTSVQLMKTETHWVTFTFNTYMYI